MYGVISIIFCAQYPSPGRWLDPQNDTAYQHGLSCFLASFLKSRGGIYHIWVHLLCELKAQIIRGGVSYQHSK